MQTADGRRLVQSLVSGRRIHEQVTHALQPGRHPPDPLTGESVDSRIWSVQKTRLRGKHALNPMADADGQGAAE